MGADFHCFKYKIEPKWEDPICVNGGTWTISCLRGKVDTLWLHTLLALIGEQFDHGDEICGAVVNVRGRDRISLWTKNASNEAVQMSIGRQWKEFLDYNETIGFIFHVEIKTAPADFRFPTTNQTRHCFTRYIEYHRCVAAKGDTGDCQKFAKYYRSLCPGEWVEKWNEQRENGVFPGPL